MSTKKNSFAVLCILLVGLAALCPAGGSKKKNAEKPSALDQFIRDAAREAETRPAGMGSTYRDDGLLGDMARDMRARNINDVVTIVVSERASAISSGNSKTSRQSSVKASVTAAGGLTNVTSAWPNLAKADTNTSLDGQGATSRQTSITTSLSARVTHVLPNGDLVLEGSKEVEVNSERQLVTVRGVARWNDISPANTVRSDSLAQMEVRVNGKGIVGDSIRRPNILYRILLGVLPF